MQAAPCKALCLRDLTCQKVCRVAAVRHLRGIFALHKDCILTKALVVKDSLHCMDMDHASLLSLRVFQASLVTVLYLGHSSSSEVYFDLTSVTALYLCSDITSDTWFWLPYEPQLRCARPAAAVT